MWSACCVPFSAAFHDLDCRDPTTGDVPILISEEKWDEYIFKEEESIFTQNAEVEGLQRKCNVLPKPSWSPFTFLSIGQLFSHGSFSIFHIIKMSENNKATRFSKLCVNFKKL